MSLKDFMIKTLTDYESRNHTLFAGLFSLITVIIIYNISKNTTGDEKSILTVAWVASSILFSPIWIIGIYEVLKSIKDRKN